MEKVLHELCLQLMGEITLVDKLLFLKCRNCVIQLRSNSTQLIGTLNRYFRHWVVSADQADITVTAIESCIVDIPGSFQNWPREPGKNNVKDAYFDLNRGRLIRKIRTGLLFLQSESCRIAIGPCLAHPNQVINFINSQYMNWLQQRNWLICHAAAVVNRNFAFAISGFSGGGKSTFMLNLMDDDRFGYLTNDRLFIRRQTDGVDATGIAKLPRINPGTIVNNPRVHGLIPVEERNRLLDLPLKTLWDIDDKFDVDIDNIYQRKCIKDEALLHAFIVLNWQLNSDRPFSFKKVSLSNRRDLLAAIKKSPGPFFQDRKGIFLSRSDELSEDLYLKTLSDIPVFEVSGRVDFESLRNVFYQNIELETKRWTKN